MDRYKPISDSKMAMLRCMVALAYEDHRLSNEEAEVLEHFFAKFRLSDDQQVQLHQDMGNGVDLDDVIEDVTDPRDRAHLINVARVIFHSDGIFNHDENTLLSKLHRDHIGTIDLQTAMMKARDEADRMVKNMEDEEDKIRNAGGPINRLAMYLTDFIDVF